MSFTPGVGIVLWGEREGRAKGVSKESSNFSGRRMGCRDFFSDLIVHPSSFRLTTTLSLRSVHLQKDFPDLHITNTDSSPSVINKMSFSFPASKWSVLDVLSSPLPSEATYDCVLDKCLLDAFLCEGTKVTKQALVEKYLTYCKAVSWRDMMVVSFGQPESRLQYIDCGVFRCVGVDEIAVKDKNGLNKKCWIYTLKR